MRGTGVAELDEALAILIDPTFPLEAAEDGVPRRPKLYAIYGGDARGDLVGLVILRTIVRYAKGQRAGRSETR
jgi:hypothetical protein